MLGRTHLKVFDTAVVVLFWNSTLSPPVSIRTTVTRLYSHLLLPDPVRKATSSLSSLTYIVSTGTNQQSFCKVCLWCRRLWGLVEEGNYQSLRFHDLIIGKFKPRLTFPQLSPTWQQFSDNWLAVQSVVPTWCLMCPLLICPCGTVRRWDHPAAAAGRAGTQEADHLEERKSQSSNL